MGLFVVVILLSVTGAQECQLEGPQNTVSVVGSNVTLKCLSQSRNCLGIEWLKYSTGHPKTVLNYNGIISSDYKDQYSVENKSSCDLIIKNVQLKNAGRFLCRALISSSSVEKTAYLVVLETQPKCTTNASMDDTVEEEGVQLSCVVKYHGTNKVSMVWKAVEETSAAVKIGTQPNSTKIAPQNETGEGVRIPSTANVTFNGTDRASVNASLNDTVEGRGEQLNCVVKYNETNTTPMAWKEVQENGKNINGSYIVASAPEVPSFTCITSFAVETKDNGETIKGLATNIPYVTCATSVIKVLYSVRNVTLSPSRSGNVITCTAKGHPSPTFKWQEMENGGTWMDIPNQNGPEFTMTSDPSKQYRCFAMNIVRGKSYNATSQEFPVNNTATVTGDNTRFTATTIISVAVGVLLLIIVLIICFCERVCPGYKCCHSGNKSKDKIKEEQPLTENPDSCIYSVVNKKQNAPPIAKPSLASTSEAPKRPQGATTQAMPRKDKSKAGYTNTYQHEEVTYADLAMEVGPRKVVPKYKPETQETLYAAVGAA